ncbi:MAG: acyltransferase family protein, partial [Bacteroidota bacterium]
MTQKIRRYDLDWLRVLVFGLLIFYHVGMYFVPWGWHIKNDPEYDWLRWPMVFVNQWRLPILFLISGMGTRFALSWRSGKQYASERMRRLWIPLAFGMLIIVPPQVYIERLVNQDFVGSYWSYYTTIAFQGIYPEGNLSWHHLWFLPYLLIYSLILTPVFLYLRNHPEAGILQWLRRRLQTKFGIYCLVIPLFLAEALLEPFFPVTHALVNDWFA